MAHPNERVMLIAEMIERYLAERPRAADTASGISRFWIEREGGNDSMPNVQQALDYLVSIKRLSRTVRADGTVIYARGDLIPE